jgi:hypothetical protein
MKRPWPVAFRNSCGTVTHNDGFINWACYKVDNHPASVDGEGKISVVWACVELGGCHAYGYGQGGKWICAGLRGGRTAFLRVRGPWRDLPLRAPAVAGHGTGIAGPHFGQDSLFRLARYPPAKIGKTHQKTPAKAETLSRIFPLGNSADSAPFSFGRPTGVAINCSSASPRDIRALAEQPKRKK